MNSDQHNILCTFPDPDLLLLEGLESPGRSIPEVNGHIHSPYSFSAFENLEQAFQMALEQEVTVLGINDFNTVDGFQSFYNLAKKYQIFPLFNIEFIGLSVVDQNKGIRINDPNNPGRIYLSGKGLKFPVELDNKYKVLVDQVVEESNKHVSLMIDKINVLLNDLNSPFKISLNEIREYHAEELVRERHIARIIRIKLFQYFQNREEQISFLESLYDGKKVNVDLDNPVALENEIRSNLLKSGGFAFIPEDEKTFLTIDQILEIIADAEGIPCYPVLLDNKDGELTESEENRKVLLDRLQQYNISCIELIPGRNSYQVLKDFVDYFSRQGFTIIFGTEHNTPELTPLTVSCRDNQLDNNLKKLSYDGACIIAAHQYFRAKGLAGYDESVKYVKEKHDLFKKVGNAVIEKFIKRI